MNGRLMGELCRAALRSLVRYFEIVAGSALTPGVIAVLQTFGNRINGRAGRKVHAPAAPGPGSELERMDYLEFIARVTSHIPDKGQVIDGIEFSLFGIPETKSITVFCRHITHGRRIGRSSLFAASPTPMIRSFSGSHRTGRPRRMAISDRWLIVSDLMADSRGLMVGRLDLMHSTKSRPWLELRITGFSSSRIRAVWRLLGLA